MKSKDNVSTRYAVYVSHVGFNNWLQTRQHNRPILVADNIGVIIMLSLHVDVMFLICYIR